MLSSLESYIIQKNSWAKFARLKLLWKALAGHRLQYLAGLLALSAEAFFTFTSPIIVKLTIDSIIGPLAPAIPYPVRLAAEAILGPGYNGGGLLSVPSTGTLDAAVDPASWVWRPWLREHLWVVGLVFVTCILFQALASFAASFSANAAAEHAAKKMRDTLYAHVQDLPYETLLRAQSGDWLQRCTSDVDTTRRFLGFEFFELFRTLLLVAFALPVMISLSPELSVWGSLVVPLILLFSIGFHRVVEKIFLGADEREGVLSGIVQENVTGVRVVRAFARQEYETARFTGANDRFRDQVFKLLAWLAIYWGTSSFLGLLQLAIVLGAGLNLMATGTISLGLLVMFLTYEQQILWPIRQFGRILADAGKTRVALGRMAELLNLAPEKDLENVSDGIFGGAEGQAWALGAIEFDKVCFCYPDGKQVLQDVSFRIESGEVVALVGPTGSGKSTIAHLLIRLYEPSSGVIRIGGRDIRTIPKRELRGRIALILQEGFLYGKTIRENIRMGGKIALEAELETAAQHAALHHVIEEFPSGYDTLVGERGVTLSGGQRQRLALARALVRSTPVMVMDDSLSAVDTETDQHIRRALEAQGGKTLLIIAHRLTTLASADRILVLEDGRITASGTHQQLSAQSGLYHRLAELQSMVEEQEGIE